MKKLHLFLLGVALLGSLATRPALADPNLPLTGGAMFAESKINLGTYAGANSGVSILGTAIVNITKGDVVVISTSTSYQLCVSRTATACDPKALGIATETVSALAPVHVMVLGLTRANVAVSSTIGQKFIPSGTAGYLTGVATVSESLYTPLSTTAMIFTALETRTVSSGAGSVYGFVRR